MDNTKYDSPEYMAKCEDTIRRNFEGYAKNIRDKVTLKRLNTIKKFIQIQQPQTDKNINRILSVGSGGFEPKFIGANFACDVSCLSHKLLDSIDWKGVFICCPCDRIPYPPQYFDVVYCTEVIEHLPALDDVRRAIEEVARVGKFWLFTTPNKDVHEPTHNFIFSKKDLIKLTEGIPCHIEEQGIFFYIHNGKKELFN